VCIRDLPLELCASVAQNSVACIRQNGLSSCAHRSHKRPLRASVSETTLVCIRFQVTKNQHLDPHVRKFGIYYRGFTTEATDQKSKLLPSVMVPKWVCPPIPLKHCGRAHQVVSKTHFRHFTCNKLCKVDNGAQMFHGNYLISVKTGESSYHSTV